MNTMRDDENRKVRSGISDDYGDIAVVGFGESVLETVRQLTMMPHDESYFIQTRTEMAQLKDKRRRLILVIADMTESFARENLLKFLMTLSPQKVCVVIHNTMGTSPLVQDIGKYVSILNTSQQEEKDLKMLTQNLYDIVSHKDESLDHLDVDKNYYQLTSDTFFEKGSQCYIYSETNGLSLKNKLQSDALLNQRLINTKHCWLKVPPGVGLENAAIEEIDATINEDADFFFYGSNEENCTTYLLLIV